MASDIRASLLFNTPYMLSLTFSSSVTLRPLNEAKRQRVYSSGLVSTNMQAQQLQTTHYSTHAEQIQFIADSLTISAGLYFIKWT